MAERMIEANGVALCTEPFGDPADPPILLVMGIGGSMLWWDEGFCRMLAERRPVHHPLQPPRHRRIERPTEPGSPAYSRIRTWSPMPLEFLQCVQRVPQQVRVVGVSPSSWRLRSSSSRSTSPIASCHPVCSSADSPAAPGDQAHQPHAAFGRHAATAGEDRLVEPARLGRRLPRRLPRFPRRRQTAWVRRSSVSQPYLTRHRERRCDTTYRFHRTTISSAHSNRPHRIYLHDHRA